MKKYQKTIYYCGNILLDCDNSAVSLANRLRKRFPEIEFVHHDPSDNLPILEKFIILDVVFGIEDVTLIEDIACLHLSPAFSVHDWDLAVNLKLLHKLGLLKKILIIGLPADKPVALYEDKVVGIIKKQFD